MTEKPTTTEPERTPDRNSSCSLPRAPRGRVGEGAPPSSLPPHSRGLTPTPTSKARALDLRHTMSIPERVLWSKLSADRCFGIKFRRQHPMGDYIADFYCRDAGLVIEVDGRTHAGLQREHDDRRDAWMQSEGVEVLRVPAWKISKDVELVVREILVAVERRMELLHPGRFAEKKAEFLEKRALKKMKKKEPSPQPSPTRRESGIRKSM